ncbi:phosphoenolpyruvate--protein phosphotransferase [Kistimonas scapharcae]|uniref:phosphoenolpyruvate--protein phosphotransferase n=1 Tax=Kistimonas scapharcae TaxID=1036133 RepID=A0ABP8V706_9GAMM
MKDPLRELTGIVQSVALSESPDEQIQQVVIAISRAIGADVCSLYRKADCDNMVLVACHGLETPSPLVLPGGTGLVGLVARSRRPINLSDAATHPDFVHIPGLEEDAFPGFCGVPLVRRGEVVGVLVVLHRRQYRVSDETEAFLLTLASHLALVLVDIKPSGVPIPRPPNQRITGQKGAPGVGIGRVRLCRQYDLDAVPDTACDDIERTVQEWHNLLVTVSEDLCEEREALIGDAGASIRGIFDAYQMMLNDTTLKDRVESEIRTGRSLPSALRLAVHYFSDLFLAMEDAYLKARHEDIRHLGNKLFHAWRGGQHAQPVSGDQDSPVVLVGTQVSVSDIAAVPGENLAGVVCLEGSSLSHTAVLANALGVPVVVSISVLPDMNDGDELIVDGNTGHVILRPTKTVREEYRRLMVRRQRFLDRLESIHGKPAITTDGVRIELLSNTGLLADITPGLKAGAEGVGLYRTEIPFMVRSSFPGEEEQVQVYRQVLSAYAGMPVYMRTLDVGGDKQLPYLHMEPEENPALGWRGIRFTLDNIPLLMVQVRAMIRASQGLDNLHILLPMVSATDELDIFLGLLDDVCRQLQDEGYNIHCPQVGVMVEVPAAISQLIFWRKRIDFVSIGSNDLSQYLLALDRNNARVASRYDPVHPAVLHEIQRIVHITNTCGLPVSLCGEMGSDPVAVVLLAGMGIQRLSMSSAKLPEIKWLIRSISQTAARELLDEALKLESVSDIRTLVQNRLQSLGLGELTV